jgi:hypothetical protein
MNHIVEEPAQPTPTKRSNSLTSQLSCISPSKKYQPKEEPENILEKTVPDLLEGLSSPSLPTSDSDDHRKLLKQYKSKRSDSLQKIYNLTKKGHEQNRIPLVSSDKWDIIRVLSTTLMELDCIDGNEVTDENSGKIVMNEDRRLILWTLNNLSIPYENKLTMAKGDSAPTLFQALTSITQANLPSSYLCIICFMNLTFLAQTIEPVIYYAIPGYERSASEKSPSHSTPRSSPLRVRSRSVAGVVAQSDGVGGASERNLRLLENPASLLRAMERMMLTNSPFLLSTVTSVQGEAIRWACGLIRNVTFADQNENASSNQQSSDSGRQGFIDISIIEEICTLISQTEIPRLIVSYVRDSPNPAVKWTKDSLEDICLGVICQLAQWPSSREALKRAGATQSLEKVEG